MHIAKKDKIIVRDIILRDKLGSLQYESGLDPETG